MCLKQRADSFYAIAQRLVTWSERDRITLFNVSLQEFCQGVGSLNGQAQSTIGGDEPLMGYMV